MKKDLPVAGLMVLFGIAYLYGVFQINEPNVGYSAVGPRAFPMLIGVGLVLSGIWLGVQTLLRRGKEGGELEQIDWVTWGGVVGLLLAYILLLQPIGYLITTTLYMFGTAWVLGSRLWWRDLPISLVLSIAIYYLFNSLLKIGLPSGILG